MRTSLHQALNESPYVPEFWDKTAEQVYEDVAFRNIIGNDRRLQSSGVAFARKENTSAMEEKDAARARILESLSRGQRSGALRILTMPGLRWKFEHGLLNLRDYYGDAVQGKRRRRRHREAWRTRIYAVEYDPAIFFGSVNWMPGIRKGICQLSPHALATSHVACYYHTDAESFIRDPACPEFDAAWLDFTGYMTPWRLSAIRRFWRERCTWQLAVTVLNQRYPSSVKAHVLKHGGMAQWITNTLGGRVHDVHHYFDEYSAMLQIIIRKGK